MYQLLIVDDEAMIRKGLSRIIQWDQIGFELVGAVDHAQAALEIIEHAAVDVLLTDISMPQMSGLELIRIAKEKNPMLRSVVISGYSEFDYAVEALRLRVETYILKPLDPHKITEIFQKLKASMDEERKQQERVAALHSRYELMRLLNSDVRMIRSVYGNQKEEKLFQAILIQIPMRDSAEREACPAFVENILTRRWEFYRTAGNLTAIITLSTHTDELVDELLKEFQKREIPCRMAVSRKSPALSDAVTLYLNAADELRQVPSGSVRFSRDVPYKQERKDSKDLLSAFIRTAEEEGQSKLHQLTDRLFVEFERSGAEDAAASCASVLRGMALYFKLERDAAWDFCSAREEFSGTAGQEQEDGLDQLKKAFLEALDEMLNRLKENSESLSVMVSARARQYINENYMDKDLSLKMVAAMLNVSYSYLSTEFSRTFGDNFKAYLVSVRMEKARELLLTRRYKIYEIADLVGYSSSRYFTDTFKKKYGISPVDYLNRLHQGL